VTLILEFAGCFLFILVLGYLLPAGRYHYRYYVRGSAAHAPQRIQHRWASRKDVWREVKLSLVSILIFAALSTVLVECYKAGYTRVYWHFRDYPYGYFFVSVALCIVIHDTWFYWTHRFMHWRPVFKYFHAGHHRSLTPTPWAIYAFQPLEAVTQFVCIMGLVLFLPLHPLALLVFGAWNTEVNTAGHCGYEVVPRAVSRHPLLKMFNTVSHHDAHHTNARVNFGASFNIWDRWMGTFHDATAAAGKVVVPAPPEAAQKRRVRRSRLLLAWKNACDRRAKG
jgi:sterol desaturase/sphingolipid hydroxylase (fatty acid hydroxylase superfamily)